MKHPTYLFMVLWIGILACQHNENLCPDEDANCNDSDITVADTFCMFQGIILDSVTFISVSEEELWGDWELFAYADLTECTFTTKPADMDRNVWVHFSDTGYVNGNTPGNTFWGNYTFIHDSIQFIDIRRTIVGEPDWGSNFLDAIYYTDMATIKNDTLVIYYHESNKAMLFSKYVE